MSKMLCSHSVVHVMFLSVSPRKHITLVPYLIFLQGLENSLSRLFHVFFLADTWGCWSLLPPQYLDVIEGLLGPVETIQMPKCMRVTSRYVKCYDCRSLWPEISYKFHALEVQSACTVVDARLESHCNDDAGLTNLYPVFVALVVVVVDFLVWTTGGDRHLRRVS